MEKKSMNRDESSDKIASDDSIFYVDGKLVIGNSEVDSLSATLPLLTPSQLEDLKGFSKCVQ